LSSLFVHFPFVWDDTSLELRDDGRERDAERQRDRDTERERLRETQRDIERERV